MVANLFFLFFAVCMTLAIVTDLWTQKIPNWLNGILALGFFVMLPFSGFDLTEMGYHLLAGLVVFVVGYLMFAFSWIGAGDAKFMAATAPWLGFAALSDYILIFSVLGALLCFAMIFARKFVTWAPLVNMPFVANWLCHPNGSVPYGLALAPAGLFSITKSQFFLNMIAGM